MKRISRRNFLKVTGMSVVALSLAGCGASASGSSTAAASASSGSQLAAPTDFTIDPNTGDYSFNATDEKISYYFVRFYQLEDGKETGEYVASSPRINGGKSGAFTGTLDLSDLAWGAYHVNLTSFAAAGSGDTNPDPVTLTVQYGVGLTLERPEMLAIMSGNQVELVVDWWTLCDYNFREYMPEMKFTFYSDEACTQEVKNDTVNLADLIETRRKNPPGLEYIWGYSTVEGHMYTTAEGNTYAFTNDIYPYTLDAGTYYVTAQALSKDEYSLDSQVSTPIMVTLTADAPSDAFTTAATELWTDPQQMDMPGANPGEQKDRVDACTSQPISGQIIE